MEMAEIKHKIIMMADDDEDDKLLMKEAFGEVNSKFDIIFVSDGNELLDYLRKCGKYLKTQYPDIILLDLNMPNKSGTDILIELKTDKLLKYIPIIIFTTSSSKDDVKTCYDRGAASFILKPDSFEDLVNIADGIEKYWTNIASLPDNIVML